MLGCNRLHRGMQEVWVFGRHLRELMVGRSVRGRLAPSWGIGAYLLRKRMGLNRGGRQVGRRGRGKGDIRSLLRNWCGSPRAGWRTRKGNLAGNGLVEIEGVVDAAVEADIA